MDKKRDFIVNTGYFFVWGALIYFGITLAAAYLLPFLFGIIIAYFVQKPAKYFSFKLGVKKQNCAAILSVLIFVLLATLICLLSWILISQFSKAIKYLSDNNQEIKDIFKGIYTKIENLLVKIGFKDAFKNIYEDAIDSVAMTITTIFSKAATTLVKKTPTVFLSSVVTIVATAAIPTAIFLTDFFINASILLVTLVIVMNKTVFIFVLLDIIYKLFSPHYSFLAIFISYLAIFHILLYF